MKILNKKIIVLLLVLTIIVIGTVFLFTFLPDIKFFEKYTKHLEELDKIIADENCSSLAQWKMDYAVDDLPSLSEKQIKQGTNLSVKCVKEIREYIELTDGYDSKKYGEEIGIALEPNMTVNQNRAIMQPICEENGGVWYSHQMCVPKWTLDPALCEDKGATWIGCPTCGGMGSTEVATCQPCTPYCSLGALTSNPFLLYITKDQTFLQEDYYKMYPPIYRAGTVSLTGASMSIITTYPEKSANQ